MDTASIRVLVVDDYEPWRRFVCSTCLKLPQLRVVAEASDGLEAVQKAQELQPDLIVLDVGLPTLNGIEAALRIHRVAPSTKVLFASQSSDVDVVRAALANGARGYLLKANCKTELLPALDAVIRGERFVSKQFRDQTFD